MVHSGEPMRTPCPYQTRATWATLGVVFSGLAFLAVCCGLLGWLAGHEEICRLELGSGRVIVIYAESAFHYEPPGFVYYKVIDNGIVRVPQRRFQPVGSERIPLGRFASVSVENDQLVAVLFGRDAVIFHDFGTGRTWPGEYATVDWEHFRLAKEFLKRFEAEGKKLRCEAVEEYLSERLPSPDGTRFVTHVWEPYGEQGKARSRLTVQVVDREGNEIHVIRTADTMSFEQQLSWNLWRAGWLSEDTFAVWASPFGTRIWRFLEDGSYTERPQPIGPADVDRIKQLPEPRWWIMHSR